MCIFIRYDIHLRHVYHDILFSLRHKNVWVHFLSFSLRFDPFLNRSHDGNARHRRIVIQEHHFPQITEVRTLLFFFAVRRKRVKKRGQLQTLAGTVNGSRRSFFQTHPTLGRIRAAEKTRACPERSRKAPLACRSYGSGLRVLRNQTNTRVHSVLDHHSEKNAILSDILRLRLSDKPQILVRTLIFIYLCVSPLKGYSTESLRLWGD